MSNPLRGRAVGRTGTTSSLSNDAAGKSVSNSSSQTSRARPPNNRVASSTQPPRTSTLPASDRVTPQYSTANTPSSALGGFLAQMGGAQRTAPSTTPSGHAHPQTPAAKKPAASAVSAFAAQMSGGGSHAHPRASAPPTNDPRPRSSMQPPTAPAAMRRPPPTPSNTASIRNANAAKPTSDQWPSFVGSGLKGKTPLGDKWYE